MEEKTDRKISGDETVKKIRGYFTRTVLGYY
jgi:hypothetical protein